MKFGCRNCNEGPCIMNDIKWFDLKHKRIEPLSTDEAVGSAFKNSDILEDIFNYGPKCIRQYYKDLILKAIRVYSECELKGVIN